MCPEASSRCTTELATYPPAPVTHTRAGGAAASAGVRGTRSARGAPPLAGAASAAAGAAVERAVLRSFTRGRQHGVHAAAHWRRRQQGALAARRTVSGGRALEADNPWSTDIACVLRSCVHFVLLRDNRSLRTVPGRERIMLCIQGVWGSYMGP